MVHPKYSPEEALQRVKLMMKYDTSKTLNENKSKVENYITERKPEAIGKKVPPPTNFVSDEDLMGQTGALANYIQTVGGSYNILDVLGIRPADLIMGRRKGVKGAVDALDGWVDINDLAYISTLLKALEGKCYYDDVDEKNKSATERFLELYSEDESGDDLKSDIQGVGTSTLRTGAEKLKKQILKQIDSNIAKGCSSSPKPHPEPDPRPRPGSKYKPCTGTYKLYCIAPAIGKVQACLGGLTVDNKFGPNTEGKLKEKGFTTFTDADVDKICSGKKPEEKPEIEGEISQFKQDEL